MDGKLITEFQQCLKNEDDWTGDYGASLLFDVWVQFKKDEISQDQRNLRNAPSGGTQHHTASPSLDESFPSLPDSSKELISPQHVKFPNAGFMQADTYSDENQASRPSSSSTTFVTPQPQTMGELLSSVIRWPEAKTPQRKRMQVNLPCVVTADKWKEIMEAKENQGENKNKPKRVIKPKTALARRKPKITTEPPEDKISKPATVISQEDVLPTVLQKNDFVIIRYEGEYFPGLVIDTNSITTRVSVMTMSGPTGWKWPERADILWYDNTDVVEKITPPGLKSSHGCCSVPEIVKYRDYRQSEQ